MFREHNWEEELVLTHLKELQNKGLVKAMDHGAFTRIVQHDTDIQVTGNIISNSLNLFFIPLIIFHGIKLGSTQASSCDLLKLMIINSMQHIEN